MNETQRLEKIAGLLKKVNQKQSRLRYVKDPIRKAALEGEIADLRVQAAKLQAKR